MKARKSHTAVAVAHRRASERGEENVSGPPGLVRCRKPRYKDPDEEERRAAEGVDEELHRRPARSACRPSRR